MTAKYESFPTDKPPWIRQHRYSGIPLAVAPVSALGPYEGDTALLDTFLSSGMVFESASPR